MKQPNLVGQDIWIVAAKLDMERSKNVFCFKLLVILSSLLLLAIPQIPQNRFQIYRGNIEGD